MKKILLFAGCMAMLSGCADSEKFWNDLKQIDEFSLSADEVTIHVMETKKLEFSSSPEKSATQFDWSSADGSIVGVDQDGRISGISLGETTVTAVYKYSQLSDNVVVKVIPMEIRLSSSYELMERQTIRVAVESIPSLDASSFTWKIADNAIATVDGQGNVKGIAEGTTRLTVSHESGASASAEIVVTPYSDRMFSGGEGSETNPYIIATAQDILQFGNCLGEHLEAPVEGTKLRTAYYRMDVDIDMTGQANFIPACDAADKPFNGTFDGNGHSITNLAIGGEHDATGFIGYIGKDGVVRNLNIGAGCVISSAMPQVGSVAGYSEGTIENCTFAGGIVAVDKVGGIVGKLAAGYVGNCRFSGSISAEKSECGGIAGVMEGGRVNSCVFDRNAALVSADGTSGVGGVIGNITAAQDIAVNSCAVYGDITGRANIGGVIGKIQPQSDGQKTIVTNSACIGSTLTTIGLDGNYHTVAGIVGYTARGSSTPGSCTLEIIGCSSRIRQLKIQSKAPKTDGYLSGIAGRVNSVVLVIADCYTDFYNDRMLVEGETNAYYTFWGAIGGGLDAAKNNNMTFPYAYSPKSPVPVSTSDKMPAYRQVGGGNLGGTRLNCFIPSSDDCQVPAASMTDGTLLGLLNDARTKEEVTVYGAEIDEWVAGTDGYPISSGLADL